MRKEDKLRKQGKLRRAMRSSWFVLYPMVIWNDRLLRAARRLGVDERMSNLWLEGWPELPDRKTPSKRREVETITDRGA